jgi:hypothetical protein
LCSFEIQLSEEVMPEMSSYTLNKSPDSV